MTELIAKIARWIWNKLVVLILIVIVLLAANWFRSEWKEISAQLGKLSTIEKQIEDSTKNIEQRRAEFAKNYGDKARKALDEINTQEKAVAAAWRTAKKKKAAYDKAAGNVKSWLPKFAQLDAISKKETARGISIGARNIANAAQKTLDMLKKAQENSPWANHQKELDAEQAKNQKLQAERDEILTAADRTPAQKLIISIREVLPSALWILVGIILSPILIKGFLYFILAPLISRTKPVVVCPEAKGDVHVGASAVSTVMTLEPGDEVIVHSNHLQAAGAGPGRKTRWIFSWRMPFTSLAAGLYMMVIVRNRGEDETRITVSSKKDLFDMICDVSIPAGSSMVIYPRSLVGIVMKNGVAPKITRHWQLASLHSWITFQFRYIVIHGEAKILMKGCRGIRAERVETTKPSMQDQLATLGFTANLGYSGIRCETFVDYLLGRDELFNDRFSNADGFHFTEEVPNANRKTGIFGRGLEGLIDGFLKAFGI